MIRFFTYSQFHGKYDFVGSDNIRALQVIKYWPEADLYKYGENPDVLIFTKVFISQDYEFQRNFKGIKILDICDPMWFEGSNIVETCHAMDAITVPTENLAKFIRQFHSKVYVVPDRFDLSLIPKPRNHITKAKKVVWFGYSHNAETLRPAIPLLEELGLDLFIISNDDPIANRWGVRDKQDYYSYKKYDEKTIYQHLQTADFAVLPDGLRPEDHFKSNNKTIKAVLSGLPVAKTPEEVRDFIEPENRVKWLKNNYDKIKQEYNIINSVNQYKEIINAINL